MSENPYSSPKTSSNGEAGARTRASNIISRGMAAFSAGWAALYAYFLVEVVSGSDWWPMTDHMLVALPGIAWCIACWAWWHRKWETAIVMTALGLLPVLAVILFLVSRGFELG